ETIEEYRILHKGAVFFTNTAIAVHKKDFISKGINTVDDEQIGFDAENNKPVSFPLEIEKKSGASDPKSPLTEQESSLRSIPAWHGLFVKNKRQQSVTTLSISILAMMFLSVVFVLAAKGTSNVIHSDMPVEPLAEIRYLPSAIEILEKFSCDIVEAGGRMTYWKYNEGTDPLIEIQTQGIDVWNIYKICHQYKFAALQEIQDVNYKEEEPLVTIHLNQPERGYTTVKANTFPSQSSTIQLISDISNLLRQQKVSINSEILPTDYNGKEFYTITYNAKDWNLISSLEIIAVSCNEYLLNIKSMGVSITNENNLFTVNISLSRSSESNRALYSLGSEKSKIPIAFNYREDVLDIALSDKTTDEIIIEEKPKNTLVGSIKDLSGQMVFYHDASTKKIIVRESYD
ncbi:MAG: hypothetical protein LBI03_07845, partial [Clostridiales bacterium]|nr:hypothetical protein [Clostridiales bacterium]